MNQTIRCAIVGCGVIAPTHIESLQQLPGVEVIALCDLIIERAQTLAQRYNVPHTTTDYHNIVHNPEIDLVCVCTDHASHAPISVAMLDAGKHVICEKCLTSTPDGLQTMRDAALRHPELVFSGIFQHRCEPTNILLKKLIAQGAFGTMLTASLFVSCLRTDEYYNSDPWRGTWSQEGGSVLINQAIHHLDLLRFFLGDVEMVAANFDNLVHKGVIETEDTITIAFKFASGVRGSMIATSGSQAAPWHSGYTFTGSEGFLEYINFKPQFMLFKDPAKTAQITADFANCNNEDALHVGKNYYGGGHPAQIAEIIAAIRAKRQAYVTALEAAKTAELVQACYEAGRSGKWLKI